MAEGPKLLDADTLIDEILAKKGPHVYQDGLSEENWEEVSRAGGGAHCYVMTCHGVGIGANTTFHDQISRCWKCGEVACTVSTSGAQV